ncbi:prepilin-type N-terminal cleavage/methylation domain-containing protein [Candidatus Sumerlaeota bacterium]|nr:prepilin-type N-terminal cleavage/methylation domain-containing protein [Candidatus Sumerlaeota bacterium]
MIRNGNSSARGFTLIELLIVVAIIIILALIATVNLRRAQQRALRSADAANLHTIATALQSYFVDYDTLPPADREAGPFMSHTQAFTSVQNGPAAGGSWDGLPWLLYDKGYLSDWKTLFCPKYLRLFSGPSTIRGEYPRFHNFRYAYNASAMSSGGLLGGAGNVMSGTVWIVRDLYVGPKDGWWGSYYPKYPGDYDFPWGEGENLAELEYALYSDMAPRLVIGGTDKPPTE